MIIIGCDCHPSYQQVARLDTETGRIEDHKLMHANGEAERFYRELASSALVGIEAVGNEAPTLIARGEFDGISSQEDLLNFYSKLRVQDRQFNVMPGAAHSLALGTNREQFWHVMKAFLDMPPRRDVVKG